MIYFCIPAYNEERTVGVVLWKLRQVMGELQRDYQIIVVDDASSDSTPAVLSPYIRVLPLTVIRNTQRRGYTDSLELAVREALRRSPYPKRDAVIVVQADFTEDPDVLPLLLKRFEAGADLVATDVELEADAPRARTMAVSSSPATSARMRLPPPPWCCTDFPSIWSCSGRAIRSSTAC